MDIPSKHVYQALEARSVNKLYHANSVITACHFIESCSLLSRGTVERMGLAQTPQASDGVDKRYDIWFDVFMDSDDIHHRARRANQYGPVLFVINAEILVKSTMGRLSVTKLNPLDWSGKVAGQRWFKDKSDLQSNLVKGRFEQMIVARHCGGVLPLKAYLQKIIVDDPDMETSDGIDFYSMAVGALRLAMEKSRLDVPIERRRCRDNCSCKADWGKDKGLLFKMFDPKTL